MKKYFLIFLILTPIYASGMEYWHGLIDPRLGDWEEQIEKQTQKNMQEVIQTIDERINKKLDLDAPMPSWHGQRPLHRAAYCDKSGLLVKRLLIAGANTNVIDNSNQTPLHFACQNQSSPNIQLLFQYGINPNALRPSKQLTIPFNELFNTDTFKEKITKNPKIIALLSRIVHHKKQAFFWLLKSQTSESLSQFRRLPSPLIKVIIDAAYPGFLWPSQEIPRKAMLEYLLSTLQ